MRKPTLFKLISKRVACSLLLGSLALLLLGWLPACSLLQKSGPVTNTISEEEYLGLCAEYGLYPHRSPDVLRIPIPFKTVAEARAYVAELAKSIHHQSDGQAFYQLQLRYPAPPTLAQHTSLGFLLLKSKRDIFGSSNYQGYRYAVYNPNDLQEKPRILEVLVDKKGGASIPLDADGFPRSLYAALMTGAKDIGNFTGYAFLYTDTYHRLKGKSYLNGQVFTDNVVLRGKRDSQAAGAAKNSKDSTPPTTNATNSTNGCVHWIDYYASDGTHITTNCLGYADYGSDLPWGGTTTGPAGPAGSPGGGGTSPVEDNPSSTQGIAIIRQQYGVLPGQQASVTLAYEVSTNTGTITYFDSGLTGAEGVAQWVHQVGQQRSLAGNTFTFVVAFKINILAPSGYIISYGTRHILTGTYNIITTSGYLAIPKYW